MKRTVYLPPQLDALAKEKGLPLSQILQAGIERELQAMGAGRRNTKIEAGTYRVDGGVLVHLDGPHASGVKPIPATDNSPAAIRISRKALGRWAAALDD